MRDADVMIRMAARAPSFLGILFAAGLWGGVSDPAPASAGNLLPNPSAEDVHTNEITITRADTAEADFTFTSPVSGKLEYLVMYLYDRTEETPKDISTPMDVYRETIGGGAGRCGLRVSKGQERRLLGKGKRRIYDDFRTNTFTGASYYPWP